MKVTFVAKLYIAKLIYNESHNASQLEDAGPQPFFTQVNISISCLELIKLCNFIIIIIIPFSRNYKGKGYKL